MNVFVGFAVDDAGDLRVASVCAVRRGAGSGEIETAVVHSSPPSLNLSSSRSLLCEDTDKSNVVSDSTDSTSSLTSAIT